MAPTRRSVLRSPAAALLATSPRLFTLRQRSALAITIGLALCAMGYVAASIYRYSFETDPASADAAVVLGAAVWRDRPSPVLAERIRHGVNLYRSGRVRALIFTGGLAEGDVVSEAEAGKNMALEAGVPSRDVLVETTSTTTYENLVNARPIAGAAGLRRLVIVSDPLHMKRAITMATDLGLDAHPSPTPTTRYVSLRSRLAFLARETYYSIRYWLGCERVGTRGMGKTDEAAQASGTSPTQ